MVTRTPRSSALVALGLAALLITGLRVPSGAGEEPQVLKSARGGFLAKAGDHQFEVFFYPTGVRVFPQDHAGAAVDASQITGNATFYHPNSPKPWFSRPLRGTPQSLDLAIGLTNAPQAGVKVAFEITGLSAAVESRAGFTVPLEFVPQPAAQPTVAQPTAPQGGVPIVPRYTYGPGYQGYGYYPYTSPATEVHTSARQSYMSSIPGMYGPGGMSVGPGHRDWSTGRDSPLAKPWMRARD
jgi:hypothetical protein